MTTPVAFAKRRRCPSCHSKWLTLAAPVQLSTMDVITALRGPVLCARCGAEVPLAFVTAPVAHGTLPPHDRLRALEQAKPEQWIRWEVYPPSRATNARVAASELRLGKRATVLNRVGEVEACTDRLPTGEIAVMVRRACAPARTH